MSDIIHHFETHFKIVFADTPLLIQECHKLRYQAYCVEKGYVTDNSIDTFEIDEYDTHALHCLILHKHSDTYAATIRLILPTKNVNVHFPLEAQLTPSCLTQYDMLVTAPREQIAEVSRLVISRSFRQRTGEKTAIHGLGNDFGMLPPKQKREFTAQISLGLFKAIYQLSTKHNINYWLALMEPQLIRLLSRIGIHFSHLSEHIQYYGNRLVCFENINELAEGVRRQRPDIWDFFADDGLHENEIALPIKEKVQ